MLKSKKMKEYFTTHKNEKDLLIAKMQKMIKEFKKHEVTIPNDVPTYLYPSFMKKDKKRFGKLDFIMKKSKKYKEKMEQIKADRRIKRENPVSRNAETLPALGSHKTWKIRHKIKKRVNKKRIRKGFFD